MADTLTPDICVVGGGPGGIAAARAAAAAGAGVVLVEKKALGGANLWAGAVPLAALMAASGLYDALRRGPAMGVSGAPLQLTPGKLRDHVATATAAVAKGISADHLSAEGITVLSARARFLTAETLAAGEAIVRARRFILAVGAHPAVSSFPGLANVEHLTPADAFDFSRRPSHLVVIGATGEGLALAQAHQRLGIDTTVVGEGALLPDEDPEIVAVLAARLEGEGLRIRTEVKVERITRRRGGIRVVLSGSGEGEVTIDGSHLLLAAGRRPMVEGLGLEAAGIAHGEGGITVRDFRTANRRVYAIGDAIAGPASARRAEAEAREVVRAILFRGTARGEAADAPRAIATDPALASVGLGETAARQRHRDVRVWRYPFAENDRAVAERTPDGVLKVVATASGRILGATALGRDAGEHIALWSLAIANRLPLAAMARLSAPYPSRADVARALATSATTPGLTSPWRKRIIRILGKFG